MQGERQRVARNVQGCPPTSRALSGEAQGQYDPDAEPFPDGAPDRRLP